MSKAPTLKLIEHVAAKMAGELYEIGRSQGLKSKYKNARSYALNNLEKFIPHAIKHLMEMLNRPDVAPELKEEIYDGLMERINDPEAKSLATASEGHALPNIDIAKLIPVKELPSVIKDQRIVEDYINPYKVKRH